jgi:hypothetical protein
VTQYSRVPAWACFLQPDGPQLRTIITALIEQARGCEIL